METSTRFRGSVRSTFSSKETFTGNELPGYRGKQNVKQPQTDSLTFCGFIGFLVGVFFIVRYVDYQLPTPLRVSDIQKYPDRFIEERAFNDLKLLTSYGPRVAGSYENDVKTVDAILRLLREISDKTNSHHRMLYEVQKPSGSFHMDFQDGMTSSYSKVANVIVKLEPANLNLANDSILVNCHFDSVPGSPGASDNMLACCTMLEILRVVSQSTASLRNTLIFLFNGAEENVLQASHGFLKGVDEEDMSRASGHRWSRNLRAFINLEGAGAGGREILFQTGPGNGWLLDAYTKVPHPYGSVVGEEIFQKGLIPSDTDFRIFRDFGKIPGLDMAFVKNGYVYHTKFDKFAYVTPGSMQHEGDNVLSLVQSLGNLDFKTLNPETKKFVFFDIFGLFMITYREDVAICINLFVSLVTILWIWTEAPVPKSATLIKYVGTTVAAWVIGIISSAFVGLVLNFVGVLSPYHSYPMSVFIFFGLPCLVGQVFMYSALLPNNQKSESWIAAKFTLAIVLMFSTFFTRIVFTLMFNLSFGLVGWFVSRKLFSAPRARLGVYLILGELFPMSLSLYLVTVCLDTFVPIMGRAGSEANPNIFLALLTSFTLTFPALTGIVPVCIIFKKQLMRLCGVLGVALMIFGVTFVGSIPYSDSTPMRVHIIDVDRYDYETDMTTVRNHVSGLWLFNVDPNIPEFYSKFGQDFPEDHIDIDAYECKDLYCGLPFILPVKKLIRRSHFITKPSTFPVEKASSIKLDVTQDTIVSKEIRRLTFSFVGPDHLTINFSPGENYEMVNWSLTDKMPPPMTLMWNNRPTYFIYHARGVVFERFNITVDFRKKHDNLKNPDSGTLVDINFSSFYIHGDEMTTPELERLRKNLPSWTYLLGFKGVTKLYSVPEQKS